MDNPETLTTLLSQDMGQKQPTTNRNEKNINKNIKQDTTQKTKKMSNKNQKRGWGAMFRIFGEL